MSKSVQTTSEERPPASPERGEVLSSVGRRAPIGQGREAGGGGAEDFERRWREAFRADELADTGADTEGRNSA